MMEFGIYNRFWGSSAPGNYPNYGNLYRYNYFGNFGTEVNGQNSQAESSVNFNGYNNYFQTEQNTESFSGGEQKMNSFFMANDSYNRAFFFGRKQSNFGHGFIRPYGRFYNNFRRNTEAYFNTIDENQTLKEFDNDNTVKDLKTFVTTLTDNYNKLYDLKVPTPPSIADYQKTGYSYPYGLGTSTIEEYSQNDDGTYSVTVKHSEKADLCCSNTLKNAALTKTTDGYVLNYDKYSAIISDEPVSKYDIYTNNPFDTGLFYVFSVNNEIYYIAENDFEKMKSDLPWAGDVKCYYYYNTTIYETQTYDNAKLTFNEEGEIESVNIPELENADITVIPTQINDNEAYCQAIKDYESAIEAYKKEITEISENINKILDAAKKKLNNGNTPDDDTLSALNELFSIKTKFINRAYQYMSTAV